MSFAIIQAVIRKLEHRYGRSILDDVNKTMKLIRREHGEYFLEVEELVERERPPMVSVCLNTGSARRPRTVDDPPRPDASWRDGMEPRGPLHGPDGLAV